MSAIPRILPKYDNNILGACPKDTGKMQKTRNTEMSLGRNCGKMKRKCENTKKNKKKETNKKNSNRKTHKTHKQTNKQTKVCKNA